MGATQDFQQNVCQKYGWSFRFDINDEGYWFVDVVIGIGDKRQFVTENNSKEKKEGKECASEMAIKGLKKEIELEENKPIRELEQVFPEPIKIYDSWETSTWEMFWKNPPSVVGIDTEGNQISPPVLAQISTDEYTILEVSKGKYISKNIQKVLADDSIVKVFCDNFSHRDKLCLNLSTENVDFTKPPIVDIEALSLELLGPVTTPRGLSKITTLCMPELGVRILKPKKKKGKTKARYANIGRFAMIEQGKAKPLRGMHDLNKKEQHYAALDAWCTLQAYRKLIAEISKVENSRTLKGIENLSIT